MISKLKKVFRSTRRGFTLVETLVAVFILVTSIAAPLTIASRGLNAALFSKDQITASYLAQDAVEYIRFARDTNVLAGGNWITGAGGSGAVINLTNCDVATNANGCYLDSTAQNPLTPTICTGLKTCNLPLTVNNTQYMYLSASGFFWYNQASPNVKQPFVRKITLTSVSATEYLLTVSVYWNDGGVVHALTVSENLFNWE